MSDDRDSSWDGAVIVVAVAVIVMLIGGGYAMFAYRRAETSRAIAVEAHLRAQQEMMLAEQARASAAAEQRRSDALVEFLQDLVGDADPNAAGGGEITVQQVLDAAEARLQGSELDADVEARLRETIAATRARLEQKK